MTSSTIWVQTFNRTIGAAIKADIYKRYEFGRLKIFCRVDFICATIEQDDKGSKTIKRSKTNSHRFVSHFGYVKWITEQRTAGHGHEAKETNSRFTYFQQLHDFLRDMLHKKITIDNLMKWKEKTKVTICLRSNI